MNLTYKQAWELVGGLSTPSKMPCYGWSISARRCKVGNKLREIENSVCNKCYAFRGNYNFPCVVNAMEKRWEALSNPRFVEAMSFLINCLDSRHFRWFDSGDLDSAETLEKFALIAISCPDVKFWLPTKEYGIVSKWIKAGNVVPSNLNIRLSGYMIDENGPIALSLALGVTLSEVRTAEFNCPSSSQGNKCLDCRKCWNKNEFTVAYKKH